MDPNSGAASEVGPVPFHAMPSYPYDDHVRAPARRAARTPPRTVLPQPSDWPGAIPIAARDDRPPER
jgi:hypothetical protein